MYKMSFVKKTFLYALLFSALFLKAGYAQEIIKPALLLNNTEGYQFYSFESNTLSLYNITPNSEFFKISLEETLSLPPVVDNILI